LALFKYNLINSYPLGELEKLFEKVAFRSFSDDITMSEAALIECPDILLTLSDEYMAAMVNKLSEKYRNLMIITGFGQTRSLPHYLYFSRSSNTLNNVSEVAGRKPVYETIVRTDSPEMLLDKLVIVDQILSSSNSSQSKPQK
jgi:pheromone shutdown protein TraB